MSTTVDRQLADMVEPVERAWNESKDQRQAILDEIEAFKDGKMEQIAVLDAEIRKCVRVLKILKPELFAESNGSAPGRPANGRGAKAHKERTIPDTRVAEAERFIRSWLSTHDSVRQVDLRTERRGWGSSDASLAFAVLRDEGILRKVRNEGNQKFFALTSEGEAGKTMIKEAKANA